MSNVGGLGNNISRDGIWDKICLAYPVLTSNVGAIYMYVHRIVLLIMPTVQINRFASCDM